jgi:uncharacterized protein YgiM (DUF1202 family)
MAKRNDMPVKGKLVRTATMIDTFEEAMPNFKMVVSSCVLNIREQPNKDSKVMFAVPAGTSFTVTEIDSAPEWYLVHFIGERSYEGYAIMKRFTTLGRAYG